MLRALRAHIARAVLGISPMGPCYSSLRGDWEHDQQRASGNRPGVEIEPVGAVTRVGSTWQWHYRDELTLAVALPGETRAV